MRKLISAFIFMSLTQAAQAGIQQNPITLFPMDIDAQAQAVSGTQTPVELFKKLVTSQPLTVKFECRNSKMKIEVKAYSFLNKSCTDALFHQLEKEGRTSECYTKGDTKGATLPTAIRITDARGNVLAQQNFEGIEKGNIQDRASYSYGYGKSSYSFYPELNSARRGDESGKEKIAFKWLTFDGNTYNDLFKHFPIQQSFPSLAKLNIFMNEDFSHFSGLNKYSCNTTDQGKTAKRFEIDLATGTAKVLSNDFALNPTMQELNDENGPFSPGTLFAYGWGKQVWIGKDLAFKTCYEEPRLEAHDIEINQVTELEPMTCTSL